MYLPDKFLRSAELNGSIVAFAYQNSSSLAQNFTTHPYLYHVGSNILIPLSAHMPEYGSSSPLEYMAQTTDVPINDPNPKVPPPLPPIKRKPTTKKPPIGDRQPEPLPN